MIQKGVEIQIVTGTLWKLVSREVIVGDYTLRLRSKKAVFAMTIGQWKVRPVCQHPGKL